jgi:tetratricopeptide (TPR) repeat protein
MFFQQSFLALAVAALAPCFAAVAGAATEALAPGIQLLEARHYDEARSFFELFATRHPQDAEAAYLLGKTCLFQRQYGRATEWLERATALAPRRADGYFWLARTYAQTAKQASFLRKPGLMRKAKAAWDQAVALDANSLEARADLVEYYLQAPGFMGGSVDKAREQAAEIQRRDAVAGALAYATIARNRQDRVGAEQKLEDAIRRAPADPRPRLALGALYQDEQKWDSAFDAFEAVIQAKPDDGDALYQIGKTGALSGRRLERAEECLKRYLGYSPGFDSPPLANAHFRLGTVYGRRGNKTAARSEYQSALKLDPELHEAKEALDKLE